MYKKGDKLKCINTIKAAFGPLFIEGRTYEVLHVDDDHITLKHILYANEYMEFLIDFVKENFKSISEMRENKLNQIL